MEPAHAGIRAGGGAGRVLYHGWRVVSGRDRASHVVHLDDRGRRLGVVSLRPVWWVHRPAGEGRRVVCPRQGAHRPNRDQARRSAGDLEFGLADLFG